MSYKELQGSLIINFHYEFVKAIKKFGSPPCPWGP
jgi:hypothetical protein